MDHDFWFNLLYEIDNLQMFALCKDFDIMHKGESSLLHLRDISLVCRS